MTTIISSCSAETGNNAPLLSNNTGANPWWILFSARRAGSVGEMRHTLLSSLLAVFVTLTAQASGAACYADYKAKQDNPLRLHYGVMELRGDCTRSTARAEVATRLARQGWILLNVVSIFDERGLEERKDSAGQYFLRF